MSDRANLATSPPTNPTAALRTAALTVLEAVKPRPLAPGMNWTPTLRYDSPSIDVLRAALATSQADDPSGPDDLGAAWAEAEAALPEGWVVEAASPNPHEPRPIYRAEAWNGYGGVTRGFQKADGDTPAAALRALAAALRESPDGD